MSRIGRLLLGAAVIATVAPIVAFAVGQALAPEPTDFMCFWAGADLVARGRDPYDPATWAAAVDGLFANWLGLPRRPPCPGGYAYPLWTAVATLPLGLLPVRAAALVWMVLLLGGVALGIGLLARAFGLEWRRTLMLAAITLGSQPAWLTALTSQYGGIDLLALGLLALPGTAVRPARLSLGLLLLLLKPHVAPFVVLERARAAAPRARAVVLAIGLALLLLSLLLRPAWPAEWARELLGHRAEMATSAPTVFGFFRWAGGGTELAIGVALAAAGGFLLALRGCDLRRSGDRIAVALVAGLLVIPYVSSGDALLLAAAWCAILARVTPRSVRLLLALVAVADVLPWTLYVLRDPLVQPGDVRNALVLPVTAAVLAIALRRPVATDRLTASEDR